MTDEEVYDRAIDQIADNPGVLYRRWANWSLPFQRTGEGYGCLTQVHAGSPGPTPELTDEIQADPNIHNSVDELADAIEHAETQDEIREILGHYKRWQMRLHGVPSSAPVS